MRSVTDVEALRALTDPLRQRIVDLLTASPATATEIARKLKLPRTRIYYHLDLLEGHELVRVVGHREAGGPAERIYASTADAFVVSPSIFAGRERDLNAVRAQLLEGAAHDLRTSHATGDEAVVVRAYRQFSEEQRRELAAAFAALLERIPDDPAGEMCAVAYAVFPCSPSGE
ncbi:MAG: helix-turn-helix domain-containing protein [Candidatus Eremiobacteraeota bacterium]|nr:helix-turn-helix domain-containing protein [Candidatus Eremiobacteraeota bacterium]